MTHNPYRFLSPNVRRDVHRERLTTIPPTTSTPDRTPVAAANIHRGSEIGWLNIVDAKTYASSNRYLCRCRCGALLLAYEASLCNGSMRSCGLVSGSASNALGHGYH